MRVCLNRAGPSIFVHRELSVSVRKNPPSNPTWSCTEAEFLPVAIRFGPRLHGFDVDAGAGKHKIPPRFTEHDLRGKVGSDAESLERARQLLGHADSKITERVYRRKPELIRPLR